MQFSFPIWIQIYSPFSPPTSLSASTAFRLPENQHCFRQGSRAAVAERTLIDSCDSTPEPETSDDIDHIELLFSNSEKRLIVDPTLRWRFGTNPATSYALLGSQPTPLVSRYHFTILITPEHYIVLHQNSAKETVVNHDDQSTSMRPNDWVILFLPPEEPDPWHQVHISVARDPRNIKFEIIFPNHKKKPLPGKYLNNLRAYADSNRSILPSLHGLDLHKPPSQIASPQTPPLIKDAFYVMGLEGQGGCGAVHHVISLRNGRSFAMKSFFPPKCQTGEKRRRRAQKKWLSQIHNEVSLTRDTFHVSF